MELIAIIVGAATAIFASWATLWYKIGKLDEKVSQCNETTHKLQEQLEHLLTTRLYHCDDGGDK